MHQIADNVLDMVPLAAGVESQVERRESPFGSPAHHAGFHVRPSHLTLYCLCIASPLMPAASGTIPHLIKGLVTDQMCCLFLGSTRCRHKGQSEVELRRRRLMFSYQTRLYRTKPIRPPRLRIPNLQPVHRAAQLRLHPTQRIYHHVLPLERQRLALDHPRSLGK
jgi:hypothetical protein